jgi:hypothetical protein
MAYYEKITLLLANRVRTAQLPASWRLCTAAAGPDAPKGALLRSRRNATPLHNASLPRT